MGLTALDMVVLLAIGGSAVLGFMRGFVTEVLSLFAWVAVVFALRLFHAPVAHALIDVIGTGTGAAVLAFALVAGITYFAGRMIANRIGRRTRTSILGPVDRVLGLGFGALKGLIFAALGFLLVALVIDTLGGGPRYRPGWMTESRTYPLLNATSTSISTFMARRRHGQAMFGNDTAPAGNAA